MWHWNTKIGTRAWMHVCNWITDAKHLFLAVMLWYLGIASLFWTIKRQCEYGCFSCGLTLNNFNTKCFHAEETNKQKNPKIHPLSCLCKYQSWRFYLVLEARSLFVAISKLDFMGQVLLKVVSADCFLSLIFFYRHNRLRFSKNVCWTRWNRIDWIVSWRWDKNNYRQSWWKRVPLMRPADVILTAQKRFLNDRWSFLQFFFGREWHFKRVTVFFCYLTWNLVSLFTDGFIIMI